MQKEEYFIKNACYSLTKYYLCRQNNKRSFFSSKQRHKAFRSFPNRYQFSYINKVTSLFSDRYIFIIILSCKTAAFAMPKRNILFLTELSLQKNTTLLYFYRTSSIIVLHKACILLQVTFTLLIYVD